MIDQVKREESLEDVTTLLKAKLVLQEWANLKGQNRCFWHPEILTMLCDILGVVQNGPSNLPPLAQFKDGCDRFQREQYMIAGSDQYDDVCTRIKELELCETLTTNQENELTVLKQLQCSFTVVLKPIKGLSQQQMKERIMKAMTYFLLEGVQVF